MVFYGKISSFLAVIDPNSFGLVDIIKGLMPKLFFICMPRCAKVRFWRFSDFTKLTYEANLTTLQVFNIDKKKNIFVDL